MSTTDIALPYIARLQPYALGELPPDGSGAIKLNQNENPYPPSPQVLEALANLSAASLHRYPDPDCRELRTALAELNGRSPDEVFVGNGSSEIISLIAKAFLGPDGLLAIPDPSFGLYRTAAAGHQARSVGVPTRDDFTVDADALLAACARVIVIVNPNAPTGLTLPLAEIERIAKSHSGLLVIDEAYIDYAAPGTTALPLLERCPNVLIVRTFSKSYALCGARVGYAIGTRPLIAALERVRDIYNVNAISRTLALAAVNDSAYMRRTAEAVCATRDWFAAELRALGFEAPASQTNFLLVRPPTPPQRDSTAEVSALVERLREAGIYVRHFADHPRLSDRLRISIGTEPEMQAVLRLLRDHTHG